MAWEHYRGEGKKLYDQGYALESKGQREQAYRLYRQAELYYRQALIKAPELDSGRRRQSLEDLRWICISQQEWAREEAYA